MSKLEGVIMHCVLTLKYQYPFVLQDSERLANGGSIGIHQCLVFPETGEFAHYRVLAPLGGAEERRVERHSLNRASLKWQIPKVPLLYKGRSRYQVEAQLR